MKSSAILAAMAFAASLASVSFSQQSPPTKGVLDDAQRQRLRALGGDSLLADADQVTKDNQARRLYDNCIGKYAEDLKIVEDARSDSPSGTELIQARLRALMMCEQACFVIPGPLGEIFDKYK